MIPPTRQPRPYRRAERFPFASGEQWRPLRLLLDDDILSDADVAELLNFGHYEEIQLIRTVTDALPRLEIQEPSEDFVPIHEVREHGNGVFWIWHAARHRERAEAVAAELGIDEQAAYRALVFAAASEEMDADGFVTRRDFLFHSGTVRDVSLYTPDEALALIGLALRLRGNESIGADLADLRLIGSTFHFVLAREPHARWLALVQRLRPQLPRDR